MKISYEFNKKENYIIIGKNGKVAKLTYLDCTSSLPKNVLLNGIEDINTIKLKIKIVEGIEGAAGSGVYEYKFEDSYSKTLLEILKCFKNVLVSSDKVIEEPNNYFTLKLKRKFFRKYYEFAFAIPGTKTIFVTLSREEIKSCIKYIEQFLKFIVFKKNQEISKKAKFESKSYFHHNKDKIDIIDFNKIIEMEENGELVLTNLYIKRGDSIHTILKDGTCMRGTLKEILIDNYKKSYNIIMEEDDLFYNKRCYEPFDIKNIVFIEKYNTNKLSHRTDYKTIASFFNDEYISLSDKMKSDFRYRSLRYLSDKYAKTILYNCVYASMQNEDLLNTISDKVIPYLKEQFN